MAGSIGVMFNVGASVNRTVAGAFATVRSRVSGLRTELSGLERQSAAATRLSVSQARLQTVQERFRADPSEATRTAMQTVAREYHNARRAAAQYGISVQNVAQAQTALTNRVEATRTALGRQMQMQANQNKRRELQNDIIGTVGMAMTVAAPIKVAIEYEADFADLKKVADFASAEQEKQVQQDIFNASRRTGIDASGMTKIAASAAESGAVNDAEGNLDTEKLRQFLNDAAEMSVAYGISAEEAGDRLAVYQSRMALSAEQTRGMGDAMNYLASKTNATAADTSGVVARMGAVGKMAGLSEKSIVGLAGALVSTSENKETAGTAMKSFLLTLSQGNAMTNQQKEAFAQIGISNVQGIAEGIKRGGPEAERTILSVLAAMKDLPEAEQAGIAKEIFGTESLASLAPLINDLGKLEKAFALANSPEAAGSQLREFETRSKTTAGAIDRLKASTGILGITIGSVLLPTLATAADAAVAVLKPVTALAAEFPVVTQLLMGVGVGLVALKVGALAGGYAATILSDGWNIAKGVFGFLRPSILLTNAALVRQKAVAIATATATRAVAVATKIAAAGTWLLNAAMLANPIGLVVGGLVVLGGWFAWCYDKTGSLTGAIGMMWDQFKTVVPIMHVVESALVGTWQFIKDLWNGVSLYDAGIKLMSTLGDGIMSMWEAVTAPFKTLGQWVGLVDEDAPVADAKTSGTMGTTPPTETVAKPEKTSSWYNPTSWFGDDEKPVKDTRTTGTATSAGVASTTTPPAETVAKPEKSSNWYNPLSWFGEDKETPAPSVQTAQTVVDAPKAVPASSNTVADAPKTVAGLTADAPTVQPHRVAAQQPETTAPPRTAAVTAPEKGANPAPPAQRGAPALPASPQVSTSNVNVALNVAVNGVPDGEFGNMVIAAIKKRQSDFQALVSGIVAEQRRLSYGA